jgi:adenylylsulfate kinase-like enzyme
MINIQASLEVCIKRDVKGHYLKAKMHNLTEFTGISSPFEEPLEFENTINTDHISVIEATQKCIELIINQSIIN